jgi:hypothetical protein
MLLKLRAQFGRAPNIFVIGAVQSGKKSFIRSIEYVLNDKIEAETLWQSSVVSWGRVVKDKLDLISLFCMPSTPANPSNLLVEWYRQAFTGRQRLRNTPLVDSKDLEWPAASRVVPDVVVITVSVMQCNWPACWYNLLVSLKIPVLVVGTHIDEFLLQRPPPNWRGNVGSWIQEVNSATVFPYLVHNIDSNVRRGLTQLTASRRSNFIRLACDLMGKAIRE